MAMILCIETTTTNCSVALAKNNVLLALEEDMGKQYSHAERLHPYITKILDKEGISLNDLDAIAVSKGPGSYTGLRIGVSSAKGLCHALDIPLISVDTLQALAYQALDKKEVDYIIPLLDARRMEVYSAVFNKQGERLRETQAEILDSLSFKDYLDKGKTVFVGNGVEKFSEIVNHKNAIFFPHTLPSAKTMISFADSKYKISDTEDVAYFEPYYLKDFLVARSKK